MFAAGVLLRGHTGSSPGKWRRRLGRTVRRTRHRRSRRSPDRRRARLGDLRRRARRSPCGGRKAGNYPAVQTSHVRAGIGIGYRAARCLQGQLDLTVMVTFIEDQELQQLHRVREAAVEGSIGIDAVRHCVPHPFGALLGHLRDAMSIAFGAPLVSRDLAGVLRSVLQHRHHPLVVHVRKHLTECRAPVHRPWRRGRPRGWPGAG
jgi:hypothetical protein